MPKQEPKNATHIQELIESRLEATKADGSIQETVKIEWRSATLHIPVITMPIDSLYYNPETHRIRAQRSDDPLREQKLNEHPYSDEAQAYLHMLLMGDPAKPSDPDPSFDGLKEDLKDHGQNEAGIVTRAGVLINGNTRRAALKELGRKDMRVGVLPSDAGYDDQRRIELALQMRKDHKRDYSFMNYLLSISEQVDAGELAANIQAEFRIKPKTFEQCTWILKFVKDAISRSEIELAGGKVSSLRLIDFETHQGKLEELYRAYMALKRDDPNKAEALKEQRLLALVLGKSKTDLRLIEHDFVNRYCGSALPASPTPTAPPRQLPGLNVQVSSSLSPEVLALQQLTTSVLQAKSISGQADAPPSASANAGVRLGNIDSLLGKGLDLAGRQGRLIKKRYAPVDRVSDACDDLRLALDDIGSARSTSSFDPNDLDEVLLELKECIEKLAVLVARSEASESEGLKWLSGMANAPAGKN